MMRALLINLPSGSQVNEFLELFVYFSLLASISGGQIEKTQSSYEDAIRISAFKYPN